MHSGNKGLGTFAMFISKGCNNLKHGRLWRYCMLNNWSSNRYNLKFLVELYISH